MARKMGINTKAVEARERKEEQKKAKNELLQKKKEDEYWKDDDKHINRKLDRKKEKEDKIQAERDRKLANKAAYERDMEIAESSSKKLTAAAADKAKVTRHEIQAKIQDSTIISKKINPQPIQLTPNFNHLDDGETATTVDQALDLFSVGAKK